MRELWKAIRLVGLGRLLKLARGYRRGWEETFRGYLTTHALFALLKLGLIDELLSARGAVKPAEIANRDKLNAEALLATFTALYRTGVLDKVDSGFTLSNSGRSTIEVLYGWLELGYGYDEIFVELEDMIRGTRGYGENISRRPDYVARGSGNMEALLFFPIAAGMIQKGGFQHVLDLGCGDGTFLRGLCKDVPGIKATGIDLAPLAVEDGARRASEEGLSDRVRLFARDISKIETISDELKGIEAATTFFVLHELLYDGEDRVVAFLQDYRRLFPDAPLIVFEAIRPADEAMRRRTGFAIYYHYFHDLSRQKPTDREHWKRLFARAGFTRVEERFLGFAATSVFTLH